MKILVVYKSKYAHEMFVRRLGVDPNDIEGTKNDKYEKHDIKHYYDLKCPYDDSYNDEHEKYEYIRFADEDEWSGSQINSVLAGYQKR